MILRIPRRAVTAAAAVAVGAALALATPGTAGAAVRTLPTLAGTALPLPATAGARVPFTEYEAENAATTGTVLAASRAFTSVAAEASGRRAVRLAAGQYVDFVLAHPANAVDVRYAIPDGPDTTLRISAAGHTTTVALTAAYSDVYGNYPFTNTPSDGGEHHYFDDARTMFGATLPAGTRVRMQATTANTVLDLADFERVAAPAAQPAGDLSALDYGADPTGATDSSQAIQDAINAAETAGRGLYLPAGTYTVTRQLLVDNVTVTGAGPWYSVLSGAGVGVFGNAPGNGGSTGVHLSGFAIFGATGVRNDQVSDSGLGGAMGGGSTVDNLWIEHTKVGAWFDGPMDGLTITHTRIQDTMADGINLHDGVSDVTVSDTFIRNTCDDAFAMWSDQSADHDNTFSHDTASVPVLANGFAIYGGHDNAIRDDVAADTVTQGGGVHVGNRFGSVPLSGTTTISGNLLVRTGNLVPNDPTEIAAEWFYAADEAMSGTINVSHETLLDSSYAAFGFFGKSITNVHVSDVAILRAGTAAVQLQAPGAATFTRVVALGLGDTGTIDCASGFTVTKGAGDLGWSGTRCGFPPAGQLVIAQATGVDFGFAGLDTSTTKTIDLTNPGPKPITLTSVTAPSGFTVPNTCATIAVRATCTLQVTFDPAASGNYSGLLTIDSTSPAGPYVVGLTGIGYDPNGDLALGRTATSSSEASDYYGPQRLTDGDQGTYFESHDGDPWPQTVTIDLGQTVSVDRIVLSLPPGWGTRVENIAIAADGTALVPAADYTLDPGVDNNHVTITFPATDVRTLTFTVSSNTGWIAAQLAEIEVYTH